MRGNPPHFDGDRAIPGTIPACAGEPPHMAMLSKPARDYPRVCGGTALSSGISSRKRGLSPRVRGNRTMPDAYKGCTGTIPACAGEPARPRFAIYSLRDYPRVCGGTFMAALTKKQMMGLSPRVRGNHFFKSRSRAYEGTIPACAGEPRLTVGRTWLTRDYPRVCGGTCAPVCGLRCATGLSPRVRGNLYYE